MTLSRKIAETPQSLFFIPLFLSALGLGTLYSISLDQGTALAQNLFFKQSVILIPALVGFALAFLASRNLIHKYIYVFYFITLAVLAVPFLGDKIAGTHRWIDLGLPVGVQPSEFAKIIIVIALARYLSDRNLQMQHFGSLIIPTIIVLIPTIIVLNQPDLGTAIILMIPLIPMLFWVGARPFHLFLFIAPILSILTAFHLVSFFIWAGVMAVIFYLSRPKLLHGIGLYFGNLFLGLLTPVAWNLLRPFQQKRILTLLDPDLDPLGAGYQIIQSKMAIGSGGFLGKGWGQGTQTHLKFLPVQESDFIVSVMGEEMGFLAIVIMLTVFTVFIFRMSRSAFESNDRFSGLVLIGFASIFLAHVFVNCAMTVGLIPVKGLPLPFVSYGGSFLMAAFMMVGVSMNLSVNRMG